MREGVEKPKNPPHSAAYTADGATAPLPRPGGLRPSYALKPPIAAIEPQAEDQPNSTYGEHTTKTAATVSPLHQNGRNQPAAPLIATVAEHGPLEDDLGLIAGIAQS